MIRPPEAHDQVQVLALRLTSPTYQQFSTLQVGTDHRAPDGHEPPTCAHPTRTSPGGTSASGWFWPSSSSSPFAARPCALGYLRKRLTAPRTSTGRASRVAGASCVAAPASSSRASRTPGTTVGNILREAGLDPGPKRGKGNWSGFVRRHAAGQRLRVRAGSRAGRSGGSVPADLRPRREPPGDRIQSHRESRYDMGGPAGPERVDGDERAGAPHPRADRPRHQVHFELWPCIRGGSNTGPRRFALPPLCRSCHGFMSFGSSIRTSCCCSVRSLP